MDLFNLNFFNNLITIKLSALQDGTLIFFVNRLFYIGLIIILLGLVIYIFRKYPILPKEIEINEIELGIGTNKIRIKSNNLVAQIAYKLWVELNTRKIGLQIDENNDVIDEVYNSWYNFFSVTRELIKEIPAKSIKNDKDTQKLVDISTRILNEEFRTHLTKWQARFRHWYNLKKETLRTDLSKSPQDIQKDFPQYQDLINDMKQVNSKMMYYKGKLAEIVKGLPAS